MWLTTQSPLGNLAALLCTRRETRIFLFQFHITYEHHLQTTTLIFRRILLHIGPGTLKRAERLVATDTWPLFPLPAKWKQFSTKKGGDTACLPSGFVTNFKVIKIKLI